jgi:hypothetical protein
MAILKPGTAVKFVQPVIQGEVKKVIISDDSALQYLVEYTNDEGMLCERYFQEAELEVVSV